MISLQRLLDLADPTDWLRIFPDEDEESDERDFEGMICDSEYLGGIYEGNWKLYQGH